MLDGTDTSKTKVAAIFCPPQKGPPMSIDEEKGYVHCWSFDFTPSPSVAAFDMDHTVIKPQGGRVYPRDENDWMLMNESKLKGKLKELIGDLKCCIVLISNQAALSKDMGKVKALEGKVRRVQQALGVPVAFYASFANVNRYRKPAPGLWEQLTHDFEQRGIVINKSTSFYCGDAAGRPEGLKLWSGSKRKDFADTDRRSGLPQLRASSSSAPSQRLKARLSLF